MAAYIRAHANGNANLEQWADFIAALPPDGEEARAFARAQREIGFPDPEPLPPGAIVPMDPTPVREDGLPLWEVEAVLVSDEDVLWDMWQHVERLEHPRLEPSGSYGQGPCNYDTRMRIWAADADEARAIADGLADPERSTGSAARRRLTASPRPASRSSGPAAGNHSRGWTWTRRPSA